MSLLDFTIKTAEKAGKLLLKELKKVPQISLKSKNNLLTQADLASEKLIIKEIRKHYPDHGILAEESDYDIAKLAQAPYIWIIDPLDGTTNFAHGLSQFAVSIGIFKNTRKKNSKNFTYLEGEIVVGVICAPALNEMFYAEKWKGAYLNGKKIGVSKISKVANSLFTTGFPPEERDRNMRYFSQMMDHCLAIRRMGAAALDLAYVAAGRFDGFWEFDLHPWDIAAGALIVNEAGGRVTDTNNNQLDLFGRDIFASNKRIHKETVDIFKKF